MPNLTAKNRCAVLLLLAVLGTGCASSGRTVPAAECPSPSAKTDEYLIGTGDSLQVVVWRNEELSKTVPVRPDGKISTPAGKTPSELAQDMEAVLSKYIRTPDVSVIVESQGTANQIQVVGQVATPQSLSYHAGLRLLEVVVASGGLNEFAAGNRADVVRNSTGGQVRCRVKLADLMNGDLSQNILMFPGDVLVVPESRF